MDRECSTPASEGRSEPRLHRETETEDGCASGELSSLWSAEHFEACERMLEGAPDRVEEDEPTLEGTLDLLEDPPPFGVWRHAWLRRVRREGAG